MLRTFRNRPFRVALVAAFVILAAGAALAFTHRSIAPVATQPVATQPAAIPPALASATAPAAAPRTTPTAATAPARAEAPSTAATPFPGVAGMVVGIDPETGKLGLPSKADRAALSRAANASPAFDRSDAGLTVVHRPDGSKMIDLQGRFQDYAVVRILPDGRKEESCVQGPDVDAALHGDAAPTPNPASTPVPTPEPQHEER